MHKENKKNLHRTVFPKELIDIIGFSTGARVIDATLGGGGHTDRLMDGGAGRVLAIDRDPEAISRYQATGKFRKAPNLDLVMGRFSLVHDHTEDRDWDGAIVDLGPSTQQLMSSSRGFTFREAGPLDMRMDLESLPLLEYLKDTDPTQLANQLYAATGLRTSRRVAREIFRALEANEMKDTMDLAKLAGPRRGKTHPATELFLGLRMLVNDELGEINRGLPALLQVLRPGGRLGVITFHSTEDRTVKNLFKSLAGLCICESEPCLCPNEAKVKIITKKPLVPSATEIANNPRARSAKIRCIEKL